MAFDEGTWGFEKEGTSGQQQKLGVSMGIGPAAKKTVFLKNDTWSCNQ
jgi:hypothetical protein